jgi:hypothetical protein
MNKQELLMRIRKSRKAIESLCAKKDLESRAEPSSEWTFKSLLAHLAFWEHATLDVRSASKTAESLKDVHAINADLLAKTKNRTADDVVQEFVRSGEKLLEQINSLADQQLQASSPWGDGIPLIDHLADDTCEHYEEHLRRFFTGNL